MKRNIPFSVTKIKLRATKQFYIAMIRKRMGRRIDEQALQRKRKIAGIDMKEWSDEELKGLYEEAEKEWNEYKKKSVKEKEDEMLDMYPEEIIGDSEKAIRKRCQAIKTVKKNRFRQFTFEKLTKHIGKGEKIL